MDYKKVALAMSDEGIPESGVGDMAQQLRALATLSGMLVQLSA